MEEPLGRLKPPLQCPPPGSRTEARLARSTAFLLEKGSSVPRVVWCHGRLGQSPARYCRPGIFSPPVSVPPTRSLSSPPPIWGRGLSHQLSGAHARVAATAAPSAQGDSFVSRRSILTFHVFGFPCLGRGGGRRGSRSWAGGGSSMPSGSCRHTQTHSRLLAPVFWWGLPGSQLLPAPCQMPRPPNPKEPWPCLWGNLGPPHHCPCQICLSLESPQAGGGGGGGGGDVPSAPPLRR